MSAGKILSNIWLVVSNILFFLVGAGLVGVGSLLIRWNSAGFGNPTLLASIQSVSYFSVNDIAIAVLALGSLLTLSSFLGCCGACFRSNGALKTYVGFLVLSLLGLISVGSFSIWRLVTNKNEWENVTATEWNGFNDAMKEVFQIVYQCCGFEKGDGTAYTGPSILFPNQTEYNNFCQGNTFLLYEGCQSQGLSYWSSQVLYTSVGLGVLALLMLVTIPAALRAKKAASHPPGFKAVGDASAAGYQKF